MHDFITKYIGGGLLVLIGYIIVSNTLWLIFGSKLLQSLPGVNIKGFTGTLKIAVMLVMSVIGFLYWAIKFPFAKMGLIKNNSLANCISNGIQSASKLFSKRNL